MFRLLREEAPVFRHEPPGGDAYWAITRYDDVVALSRDATTWSTELGSAFIKDMDEDALAMTRLTLLNMDPPKHTRYRMLVNRGFTPRMIGKLDAAIHDRAVRIVDAVAEKGECDFVEHIAAELPLQVICELLGVPEEDRHLIFDWSNKLVGYDDPVFQTTPEDGQVAAAEIYAYCDAIAADRRADPRDDIMSTLVHAEVDGDRLDATELNMFFVLLVVAGNETTRNLIAHSMLALIEHPDARAELIADPSLMPSATEEMLRWGCSIQNFRRTATQDTEVRGIRMAAGEKAVLYYLSANRDADVFADPDRFDIRRSPNNHVTFGGGGVHFCLGANLARLEIRVMIEEVLKRLPDLDLDGSYRRMRSDFINGITHMPVRFTPTRPAGR
jgi:cholest-4-en-3-one 26-monooxygenase